MQYGILAYLTARASTFPFFGWEWDEGRSQRAKRTTSCTFTDVPHRTNTARFKLLAIHLLSSVGLPFIYQFHPLSDYQPSKRTRGKVKKTRKGNKQHGLRKTHRPRRRARRHMSGNKIPNAPVPLRLCQSSASLPSVVYCLSTLLPFRLCTMYTNTHKADFRLEVKNRDR